jgi:sortase A
MRDSPPRRHGFSPLAIAGEILIAAGVLLLLYVGWQLFYTDLQAGREQTALLEGLSWTAPDVVGSATDDSGDNAFAVIPDELKEREAAPPGMEEPDYASTFGAMHVPRWGADYTSPISQGVTRRDVLDKLGIGHYPGTAMPGDTGNFAIAGHRTSYGKPFTDVDTLQVDDALIVQTEDHWYVYTVTDWEIVRPTDVDVIAPVPPGASENGRYITLTTCHPRYSAAQRWIVHGELDYWAPTGHGYPSEMVEAIT